VRIHQKEAETISWIFYQLRSLYGKKSWKKEKDLLGLLLRTILSQNTNDRNRDRAYQSLRQKFPSWDLVLKAPVKEIEQAIRPAGLSRQKSRRIKEILKKIQAEQGKLDLSFLARLPEKQAKKYLLSFKGIGEKTAAIILLFGLGKNFFPVDTHILRVSKRLGLIPENATARQAHQILGEIVPKEIAYELHLNLIEHGRNLCRARKPNCPACPLKTRCKFYQNGAIQRNN